MEDLPRSYDASREPVLHTMAYLRGIAKFPLGLKGKFYANVALISYVLNGNILRQSRNAWRKTQCNCICLGRLYEELTPSINRLCLLTGP